MGETARPRSTISSLGSASCFQGIAADVDVLSAPRITSATDTPPLALGPLEQALLLGRAAQIKKASAPLPRVLRERTQQASHLTLGCLMPG